MVTSCIPQAVYKKSAGTASTSASKALSNSYQSYQPVKEPAITTSTFEQSNEETEFLPAPDKVSGGGSQEFLPAPDKVSDGGSQDVLLESVEMKADEAPVEEIEMQEASVTYKN